MANSKKTKTPSKSDATALICLISLIVVIVVVATVIIVNWSRETGKAHENGTGTATSAAVVEAIPDELKGGKITLEPVPVSTVTRDDTTGTCDMAAVLSEINSKTLKDFTLADEVTDYVLFEVKGYGAYILKLRADVAPVSVRNFQNLVSQNFFDGSSFHRIMKGFMVQGGAPKTQAQANALTPIKGEFAQNGLRNELSHVKGVISMARTNAVDSATSQFFISNDSTNTPASLDGRYAAFGYVVAGLPVIDAITATPVGYSGTGELSVPQRDVIIERACFVKLK